MYYQNLYLGLGPKPKPKLADTFGNTETTFQRENLVTNNMGYPILLVIYHKICCQIFKILKLFLKIFVQFQAFRNLYPSKKQKTLENSKIFETKFCFWKKKSAPISMPKLDLSFGSWHRNLVLVAH